MTYIVGDATHILGRPLSGTASSGETWIYDGRHFVPAANEAYKFLDVDGTEIAASVSADRLSLNGVSGIMLTAVSGNAGGADGILMEVSGLVSEQIPHWSEISGAAAGGSGIAAGASGIAVQASEIATAASNIAVGGSGIAAGASGIAEEGLEIAQATSGIALGGSGIAVGSSGMAAGASGMASASSGMASYASGKLDDTDGKSGIVFASGNGFTVLTSAPASGYVLRASGSNVLTDLFWGLDQTASGGGSGSGNSYAFINVQGTTIDANTADDTLNVSGRSGILLSAISGSSQGSDAIFVEVSGLGSGQVPSWAEISGMSSGGSGIASGASGLAAAAYGMASGASGIAVTAVTPDYVPPAFLTKDADEIFIPKGRYYKGGYRHRGQYQGLSNLASYWDVSSRLTVDVDATYSSGASPGMIGGAKVYNSWYSVFLLGNTANDVIVLPFVRIKAVSFSSPNTVINPGDHNTGANYENGFIAANDAWNSYRLVKLSFDANDGNVYPIADTVNGSPDQILISGDKTSELISGDWLQLVPPETSPSLYLGVLRIDGSGNLFEYRDHKRGGYVFPVDQQLNLNKGLASSLVNTEVTCVPPTAAMILGTISISEPTNCRGIVARVYVGESGSNIAFAVRTTADAATTNQTTRVPATFPLTAVSKVRNHVAYFDVSSNEVALSASGSSYLSVYGFEE